MGSTDDGGVVEDQHAGVGEDGPGQGDALTLTTRQRKSPLADDRLVALGHRGDELVGAGQMGRPLNIGLGCVGIGEGDVGAHAVAEEERVLEHDPDERSHISDLHLADVDAVDAATAPSSTS